MNKQRLQGDEEGLAGNPYPPTNHQWRYFNEGLKAQQLLDRQHEQERVEGLVKYITSPPVMHRISVRLGQISTGQQKIRFKFPMVAIIGQIKDVLEQSLKAQYGVK